MSTTHPDPALASRRGQLVVVAMLVSTFMAAVEVTVISTAMPSIVGQLGGFDLFTWAFGIYLLGQAVTTPIYGRLADQYGRKPVYIGSVAVFLLGSLLCGCAWSMASLIGFRAIQGIGGGGLIPLANMIISDVSSPADRPRALGYVSGVWGISAIIGPLLGSFFTGTLGWPFVFWVNLPIGLLATLLVVRFLHEPASARLRAPIDMGGAALLALGVGTVMATLVQGESFSRILLAVLLTLGLAALAGFAWRERGSATPILPIHLWSNPLIMAANLSALTCGALMIGATAFLPPWIQGVLGRDALVAGFVLGALTVSWTVASMGLSRVLSRVSYRTVAWVGSLALLAGSWALLLLQPGQDALGVAVACGVLGAGLGLHSLVFNVAVQGSVAQDDRGRATSLFFFSRLIGQALGAAAYGGTLNAGLAAAGPAAHDAVRNLVEPALRAAVPAAELARLTGALAQALHGVFALGAGIAVAALLVVLLVPRRARLTRDG